MLVDRNPDNTFQSTVAADNATDQKIQANQLLGAYCVTCHGNDSRVGDILLNDLDSLDAVDRQNLFQKAHEVIRLKQMPPEETEQPTRAEREVLLNWLQTQLTGKAAKALEEKLQRFEYGNVVSHEQLFSGQHAQEPAFTEDRRWIISEYIFNEKINRLLNYHPTRTIYGTSHAVLGDSGVHWSPKTERGNKFRRTITNPYLLPATVGVRYSVHQRLTTGHLLTMVGNAKRVAGHMSNEGTMKAHYPAMYARMKPELEHRAIIRQRENFLTNYSFMAKLLEELYGKQNDKLLPKVKHTRIPYPDRQNTPPMASRSDTKISNSLTASTGKIFRQSCRESRVTNKLPIQWKN